MIEPSARAGRPRSGSCRAARGTNALSLDRAYQLFALGLAASGVCTDPRIDDDELDR